MLGVMHGVLLWADMNAATPLGAWGHSVMSLDQRQYEMYTRASMRCIHVSV